MNKLKELIDNYTDHIELDADDNVYIAKCAEFPALSAHGKTGEQALKEIKIVALETLSWMKEDGERIPYPLNL